jgi:1-acyl-sn-glycerol-3-phosphate acyltransferase
MRTLLTIVALIVATIVLGLAVIVGRLLGVATRGRHLRPAAALVGTPAPLHGGDARGAARRRADPHGRAARRRQQPRELVRRLSLAANVPRFAFVAKAELARVPLFGAAARAVNTVFIERENRKAAFESYDVASAKIRDGLSVVVFPEGTRGTTYAMRPVQEGAVRARDRRRRAHRADDRARHDSRAAEGSFWARAGTVHVHFLEPDPDRGAHVRRPRVAEPRRVRPHGARVPRAVRRRAAAARGGRHRRARRAAPGAPPARGAHA